MAHLEWTSKSGQVMALRFDTVAAVEHSQTASVTTHPVESGPGVSDHVRPELPRISLTGYVSNLPLFAVSEMISKTGNRKAIGAYKKVDIPPSPGSSKASVLQGGLVQAGLNALSSLTGPSSFDALVFNDLQSRVKQVTDALTEALEEARMFKFVDEARDYEDMVLESRAIVRTADGGQGATVQLELVQIKVVEVSLVNSPISADLRGQGMSALGSAAAALGANKNVDDKKKEQVKSLAASLYDGAMGGLF
jgi:hypothetical protein